MLLAGARSAVTTGISVPGQDVPGRSGGRRGPGAVRAARDAVADLSECGVEAGGIAGRDRVRDGPVHCGLAAEFLVGQVAHGDDEVAVALDVADVPGPQPGQRQAVAPAAAMAPGSIARGGEFRPRPPGSVAGPAPQRRGQVRARRVGGAHEQHPPAPRAPCGRASESRAPGIKLQVGGGGRRRTGGG